ncbi:modifier of mdg4 isoform X8 [Hermetia illucens]|uniref:modifier of mdg4 isoform X8 n=1 Tax=Hermetia illucens TaxID=343691 RepID=UPI0018CC60C5|nr:modifier of mdg4 isoform X8 [Hermetia illucens]
MADDEQFSLCWNNFNSNLSAGFHESLCRGDLVDVTLAAEGQFVKAHRLVLSVCSPYFRRMFTQMPANQHAFVFLKDVSHTALKDLIQFMYCGEVNVKQDALPAFISTAEALQIKGLTDSEPAPSQSPAKPSTPAPQPQPQTITTPTMTTATTTTSPRARTSNQRSRYKLESEDSGDENKPTNQLVLQQTQTTQQHQQATLVQQTQKRPAQRSITPHTAPTVKRIKNNDPLEGTDATTTTTQITVQAVTDSKSATGEPEYIDLPIDLPTKSEPDYGEEAADVEAAEQEATYVEDDSYGDMKYDESYFTENEEGGGTTTGATTSTAAVKQSVSFSDSYVSDTGEQQQAATEAQGQIIICPQKPSTPKPADEMIPLHAGSNVYISKSDLVRIFTPNPSLYTSRLADLIFSQELREASTKQGKDRLSLLDQTRLSSLINHIVQVFVRRGTQMSPEMVKRFMKLKMSRMRQKALTPQNATSQ